jgi:hypothetical protein
MRGSATPERNSTYLAELGSVAFAAAYNHGDANYQREWLDEAFKRTIPPILIVTYLLVGVRLALLGLGDRQERPWKLYAISVGISVHHGILLLTIDALISLDRRMAWAVAAIIVIEICIGIAVNSQRLSGRLSRHRRVRRSPETLHDGNTFSTGRMASEINDVS